MLIDKHGRKYGVIKITNEMLQNDIDFVGKIFAAIKAVVFRCEFNYINDKMEYTLYSPEFEELAPNEEIPTYVVFWFDRHDKEGNVTGVDISVEKEVKYDPNKGLENKPAIETK